jgi:hypothetical protein
VPITPLHGLALMFLYFRDKKRIDLLAIVAASTFIDIEPLYYSLVNDPINHKIWHSFLVASTVYPLLISFGVYVVERFLEAKIWLGFEIFKLKPERARYSLPTIYVRRYVHNVLLKR